jgi:hypothetical protein
MSSSQENIYDIAMSMYFPNRKGMAWLTIDENQQFVDSGVYQSLDALVDKAEAKIVRQSEGLYSFLPTLATQLKHPAVGATVGGLVSYLTDGDPADGALYGAILEATSSNLSVLIRKGVLKMNSLVKKTLKDQDLPDEIKDIISATNGMLIGLDEPKAVARNSIIRGIRDYEKPPKGLPKGVYVTGAIGGGLGYMLLGSVLDALMFNSFSLTKLAGMGALTRTGTFKLNNYNSQRRLDQTNKILKPHIGEFNQGKRERLVGGLVKRWYKDVLLSQ